MTALFQRFAGNEVAAILIFVVLFVGIVGGALFLTPRIAKWVDRRREKNPGFYDGMLQQDPNQQKDEDAEEENHV